MNWELGTNFQKLFNQFCVRNIFIFFNHGKVFKIVEMCDDDNDKESRWNKQKREFHFSLTFMLKKDGEVFQNWKNVCITLK